MLAPSLLESLTVVLLLLNGYIGACSFCSQGGLQDFQCAWFDGLWDYHTILTLCNLFILAICNFKMFSF
jgi:hypothetical protein